MCMCIIVINILIFMNYIIQIFLIWIIPFNMKIKNGLTNIKILMKVCNELQNFISNFNLL